MGKYTLSLLEAFLQANKENNYYDNVQLLFNTNLKKSAERMEAIQERLAGTTSEFVDLPIDISTELHAKYKQAQTQLTEFMSKTQPPNSQSDFLIAAPFFVGFAAIFPTNESVGKFAIVYDLIPQKIWHLQRIFPDDVYFNHYKLFFDADHLFTISNAVKDDLVQLVGLPEKKITSINGGPFMRPAKTASVAEWVPQHQPYILMPSGPIIHKNNERAVRGFELFNKSQNNKFTLYITSTFDEATQEKLRSLSKKIVFTGNISDQALGEAYSKASCVLFPSLAEGLGMPVLEAGQYDTPVACSDIPVLSELSQTAFYQFDPTIPAAIATELANAVQKVNWTEHLAGFKELRQAYTWQHSANTLLQGLSGEKATAERPTKKLTLRIPRPNHDSPAGYLGEQLYARVLQRYDVALEFTESQSVNTPSFLAYMPESTSEPRDTMVSIRNKRRRKFLFGRVENQVIITTEEYSETTEQVLFALRKFTDKALQLKGWAFKSPSGSHLSAEDIAHLICKKDL